LTADNFGASVLRGFWHAWAMIKPKKKRKGDANQVAYSVVQDVIRLSEKPVKLPPKAASPKQRK
jgi:hypothetical protein